MSKEVGVTQNNVKLTWNDVEMCEKKRRTVSINTDYTNKVGPSEK